MDLLVLDFESFFSTDFTLKKLTTESYIRDPRFEAHLCGLYLPKHKHKMWIKQEYMVAFFKTIDWSATAVLCHHAQFDGFILNHHYGIKPARWFDTMSMARLMLGNARVSLAALAERYNLGGKTVPYDKFRGVRWCNMPKVLQDELGAGCLDDCELTYKLFAHLSKGFPPEEYAVIDATIRMFTEPALIGDTDALHTLQMEEWTSKNDRMTALGVTAKQLQSATQFKALLEAEEVEVAMKEGKNGPIPALAATDQFMRDLCEDADERVAGLAQARLEVRSTIDETRAGRFAAMSSRGSMPVYLNYCGAQTLRWSGGDSTNWQNMRRGSALRKTISAPDGYLLAIIDLSQIEARLAAYVAGQEDLLERFRRGEDPYIPLASDFYHELIDKADKARRGMGKLGILSCQYGAGGPSIVRTAAAGLYGPPVMLTQEEGLRFRDTYREANPMIPRLWRECDNVLGHMASPSSTAPTPWKGMIVGPGYLQMPNGARMLYELKWNVFDDARPGWYRKTRDGWKRIWGGVLLQNICEGYGRLQLSQPMVRIVAEGFKVVLCTHDELVVLVADDAYANNALAWLTDQLTTVPPYLPGMPLAAEAHLSKTYDK